MTADDRTGAAHPPEFRGFFENLRLGSLSFPHCPDCGSFHWYPMKRCPHCRGGRWSYRTVAGPGTLYSWTSVHRAFSPDFTDAVPYVVALVEFPDAPGVRLVANIPYEEVDTLRVGMAVEPCIDRDAATPTFRFRPARDRAVGESPSSRRAEHDRGHGG